MDAVSVGALLDDFVLEEDVGVGPGVADHLGDRIEADLDHFAELESRNTGKPITLARNVDIPRAVSNFRFFAGAVRHDSTAMHEMADAIIDALTSGGGNNDSGGLLRAAELAEASGRPHRLLVMISDGSPTECTFATPSAACAR